MTSHSKSTCRSISRRALLKDIAIAPLLLRAAPLFGSSAPGGTSALAPFGSSPDHGPEFSDVHLTPHYPSPSPLADILDLVAPGSDGYITEKYASEIEAILRRWGQNLGQAQKTALRNHSGLEASLDPSIRASSLVSAGKSPVRSAFGIDIDKRQYSPELMSGRDRFLENIDKWLGDISRVETAEFEIYGIRELTSSPLTVLADIRYDFVTSFRGTVAKNG